MIESNGTSHEASLAWVDGPTTRPLIQGTVIDRFTELVRKAPDRIAIKTATGQVSYKQLHELSDALATALDTLGISPKDRVAVSLGHCIEYAVIVYACLKIGAILVPLNPAHKPRQVVSSLNHISASCYIVTDGGPVGRDLLFVARWSNLISCASLKQLLLLDNASGRAEVGRFRQARDYANVLAAHAGREFPRRQNLQADDIVNIQFTSGTTSSPKAACLTHRNVLNNGFFVGQGMALTDTDIICCPPPMYHCFGQVLGLMTAMTHGAILLLPAETFDPRAAMRSVVDNQATVLYGVPTMFLAYLDIVSEECIAPSALVSLRTGVVGGSPIPPTLREQLHEKMNLSGLTSVYGMTEASPIVTQTDVEDSLEKKLSTVGRVMPHTSLRIADRDKPHRVLRRGEKGEVQMSGYSIMPGYWNAEEESSRALLVEKESECAQTEQATSVTQNGRSAGRVWLRSGDEGLIDDDGYIRITGRIKDIIIRGGENIHPAEIENCLVRHELISDASVVGLLDARYGEVIASFLVLKSGVRLAFDEEERSASAADLRLEKDAVKGSQALTPGDVRSWVLRQSGKMFVPKYVFWVSSMPLTASGKIMKYRLRELGNEWLDKARQEASL